MKIGFAGTPAFAETALQHILQAGYSVELVLTQPDRRAGRGMRLQASAVKHTALAHNIPVIQPAGLRLNGKHAADAQNAKETLETLQLDVLVVAAYGLLLPAWVLQLPKLGCLNIHASLLPRWRGAAPIHRAIQAGDSQTGICIMQMDEGLDTGDILLMQSLPIAAQDTTPTLHDRLAILGGELIVQALQQAHNGQLTPHKQQGDATYANKISKEESILNWQHSAVELERHIRALQPAPSTYTWVSDSRNAQPEKIKVHAACVSSQSRPADTTAGTVLAHDADGLHIACGTNTQGGVLCLQTVQRSGGKAQPVAQWLRGFQLDIGSVLGLAPT